MALRLKLHYFNMMGRGETIRQLLVLSGQKFEDYRVKDKEWPKVKKDYPFGQLPVLEVDGKKLAQEYAICRYLARKYGYAGRGEWEEAQVDAIADQFKDFVVSIQPWFRAWFLRLAKENEDNLRKTVLLPSVDLHMPFFVNSIRESGSGFLVGKDLTWPDLTVAELLHAISKKNPEIYGNYPELRTHQQQVHSIPKIKKWREERPQLEF